MYKELFIMKECFMPNNVGLGLKWRSPYKDSINLKLEQLKEGGLVSVQNKNDHLLQFHNFFLRQVDKYVNDGIDLVAASRHLELYRTREMRKQYELSLGESSGVFHLCLFLLVLATLVSLTNRSLMCPQSPFVQENVSCRFAWWRLSHN